MLEPGDAYRSTLSLADTSKSSWEASLRLMLVAQKSLVSSYRISRWLLCSIFGRRSYLPFGKGIPEPVPSLRSWQHYLWYTTPSREQMKRQQMHMKTLHNWVKTSSDTIMEHSKLWTSWTDWFELVCSMDPFGTLSKMNWKGNYRIYSLCSCLRQVGWTTKMGPKFSSQCNQYQCCIEYWKFKAILSMITNVQLTSSLWISGNWIANSIVNTSK